MIRTLPPIGNKPGARAAFDGWPGGWGSILCSLPRWSLRRRMPATSLRSPRNPAGSGHQVKTVGRKRSWARCQNHPADPYRREDRRWRAPVRNAKRIRIHRNQLVTPPTSRMGRNSLAAKEFAQSAAMGAGRATTGRSSITTGVSAGVCSHLRTSGRACRMAISPARINSPARLKSS